MACPPERRAVGQAGPAVASGGGICGGVLLYPMGVIAEQFGAPAALLLPAVCFAVVAPYGWKGATVARR